MDQERIDRALKLIADDAKQKAFETVFKDVTLSQLNDFLAKLSERCQPDQKLNDVLTTSEVVELWQSVQRLR